MSCVNDCGRPLKRLRHSPHQRWRYRSDTTIGKLTQFHWSQYLHGEEKGEGSVGGVTIQSGTPSCRRCPFLPCEKPVDRMLMSLPPKLTFLVTLTEGTHLCMVVQAKKARCTNTTLEEQTQNSETEEVPQSVNCLSLAQCQTGWTPLGWVNRRLCAFIQTFPRASWIDKEWKIQFRGIGCV